MSYGVTYIMPKDENVLKFIYSIVFQEKAVLVCSATSCENRKHPRWQIINQPRLIGKQLIIVDIC